MKIKIVMKENKKSELYPCFVISDDNGKPMIGGSLNVKINPENKKVDGVSFGRVWVEGGLSDFMNLPASPEILAAVLESPHYAPPEAIPDGAPDWLAYIPAGPARSAALADWVKKNGVTA